MYFSGTVAAVILVGPCLGKLGLSALFVDCVLSVCVITGSLTELRDNYSPKKRKKKKKKLRSNYGEPRFSSKLEEMSKLRETRIPLLAFPKQNLREIGDVACLHVDKDMLLCQFPKVLRFPQVLEKTVTLHTF